LQPGQNKQPSKELRIETQGFRKDLTAGGSIMSLMILFVSLDHIFGHFIANGTGKVSIFSELSSPQFPFHRGISLKYCSCGCPFRLFTTVDIEYLGGNPKNM
jgi:hypothetical protein